MAHHRSEMDNERVADADESDAGHELDAGKERSSEERSSDSVATEEPGEPIRSDRTEGPEVISVSHAEKLKERRYKWVVDYRKLSWGAAALVGAVVLTSVSYAYNSRRAASTFLSRAEQAAADERYGEEVRWLRNYLLLHPDDRDRLVRSAIAADLAAENATRRSFPGALNTARKRLALALSSLGAATDGPSTGNDELDDQLTEIREKYINRLIQSRSYFLADARDQVIALNAAKNDPQAHRWMATAIAGMVQEGRYRLPEPGEAVEEQVDYYRWLSQQPPGEILRRAIELNPGDLDLATHLIGLLEISPQSFGVVLASEDRDVFKNTVAAIRRTDENLAKLIDNVRSDLEQQDNSRAALLLANYHAGLGNNEEATNVIYRGAANASLRLSEIDTKEEADPDSTIDEDRASRAAELTPESQSQVMDYVCMLQAATLTAERLGASTSDAQRQDRLIAARTWLEQLRSLGIFTVPVSPEIVKRVYLVSGQLEQLDQNTERAIELWREGLSVVNQDNLDLVGSVAWGLATQVLQKRDAKLYDDSDDQLETELAAASEAIDEFSEAIVAKEKQLQRMTSDELGATGRTVARATIRNAKWKRRVARATLRSAQKPSHENDVAIIGLLTGAADDTHQVLSGSLLDRETQIDNQIRIAGVELLAAAYQREHSWDLVGALLADAANTFSTNSAIAQSLIQQSANAWMRAGNRFQASQQYQRINSSPVPSVRLAALEARFAHQLRLLPEQRQMAVLRAEVDAFEDYINQYEKQFSADLSAERVAAQVLKTQLPPEDVLAEEFLQSVELANGISQLADDHPENSQLQKFAAERLAAAGETERATKVVDRIVASDEFSDDEKVLLRARVLAESDQHIEAAKALLQRIDESPLTATVFGPFAAEFALRGRDFELAEQALLKIPSDRLTPSNLYSLYRIKSLSGQAEDAKKYLSDLRIAERYDPNSLNSSTSAYSLLIDSRAEIDALLDREQQIEPGDPALAKARAKVARLQSLRPNWGEAVSLSGWLAFAEGNYETAINLLRSGINAGDQRMRTRQMLWRALMAEGDYDDAEREIRLASIATQTDVDPYDEVSNQIALKKGNFSQALESSEKVAQDNPEDPYAWLTFAKFVLAVREQALAGNEAAADQNPETLLEKAQDAIEQAAKHADEKRQKYAVEASRVGLAVALGGEDALEAEVERVAKLPLEKHERLQLEAQLLVALNRVDDAIDRLQQANEVKPSFNVQRMLAQLLRTSGNHDESVIVWRQALANNPDNPVVRAQLATTIVSSGKEVNWDEIAQLLNDQSSATEQNRLVYAMLLMAKGDFFQRQEAIRQLRLLSNSATDVGTEASRMQAALMLDMVRKADELKEEYRKQLDLERLNTESRQILKRLAERSNAGLTDQRNYAVFLMGTGDEDDLTEANRLIDRLKQNPAAAFEVLRLKVMHSQASQSGSELPAIIDDWAGSVTDDGEQVEIVAGEALMRSGFIREGLAWFKKAYDENPKTFGNYIVALSLAQKYDKAAEIAADQYEKEATSIKAVLLLEALLAMDPVAVPPRYQKIIDDAEKQFANDPSLLESIGTWAMQKRKFERAIAMYLKVLEQDPVRLRALNNLAMIFAEVPGRESEGLKPINQAIKIAGEKPELLDTKGTVLLRSGKVEQAVEVFSQAIEQSDEPRYKFHLVESLVALNELKRAESIWKEINFLKIDIKALTPSERESMRDLHRQFGTKPDAPDEGASTSIDFDRYTERVEYISTN